MSRTSRFAAYQECLVLPTITENLPQVPLDKLDLCIPNGLQLADPDFDKPAPIDLLLGAGVFWKLIVPGEIISRKKQPILQNTRLGWIVGGEYVLPQKQSCKTVCNLVSSLSLDAQLEKFWTTEEIDVVFPSNRQEEFCENNFKATYSRNQTGRFQVELPKNAEVVLGDSFEEALKRLYHIERRFSKQPELRQDYVTFLDNYESSGHMSLCEGDHKEDTEEFYIPHQPVVRTSSLTTKLRVVFDASSRTSLGTSLNDKLLPGPNLQSNIVELLLRFRCYEYLLTADISQMFRQIMVKEDDRKLQKILWRKSPEDPIQVYTLNTVTYGTNCAPFLAMRCLKELAQLEKQTFQEASDGLLNDFYMDDLITGANTISEATNLQNQLYGLLAQGQFLLRKWRSNEPVILQQLTASKKCEDPLINSQESSKTLGLLWNNRSDVFQYEILIPDLNKVSKRKILSVIAQIYDPLGCIGPIIMEAKLIMQELWKCKLGWDQEVPSSIHNRWRAFCESIRKLETLEVPRNVNPGNHLQNIVIHGFCDASTKGFGACIYVVSVNGNGAYQSNLLCSKSRVAPIKQITLPRLELNAAQLLTKLISLVTRSLKSNITEVHL